MVILKGLFNLSVVLPDPSLVDVGISALLTVAVIVGSTAGRAFAV